MESLESFIDNFDKNIEVKEMASPDGTRILSHSLKDIMDYRIRAWNIKQRSMKGTFTTFGVTREFD